MAIDYSKLFEEAEKEKSGRKGTSDITSKIRVQRDLIFKAVGKDELDSGTVSRAVRKALKELDGIEKVNYSTMDYGLHGGSECKYKVIAGDNGKVLKLTKLVVAKPNK